MTGIDSLNYGLTKTERIVGLNKEGLVKNTLVPKSVIERVVFDGDIVWIKSVSSRYPIDPAQYTESFLHWSARSGLKPDQIIFLSTCTHVQVLRVRDIVDLKEKIIPL